MANRFAITPANPLAALMVGGQAFGDARKRTRENEMLAGRQAAAQALQGGGDMRGVLAQLIGAGDVEGAKTIADMERARSADEWTRTYQGGMLKLAQQRQAEEPQAVQTLRATGVDPRTPEGQKLLFPRTDRPISATDKKAVFEAEDEKPAVQGTLETLDRALDLNKSAFSWYGAGALGSIGSKMPGAGYFIDQDRAKATLEWQKMMSPEALQNMANTLKGATTDFELRKFTEMLADPETPPEIRERVIGRLKTLAQRKMDIIDRRVKDLRSGTYFNPEGGQPTAAPSPTPAAPRSAPPEGAIKALRADPKRAEEFDAKYGIGAAARALGAL